MVVNFNDVSGPQISPKKLAHFVLRTRNKNAMANFYRDFLGGTTSHENEVLAFITYDEEHHRIAIAELSDLKPKDRMTCGLEHIAFTFDTLEDLFLAYRQRKARGIVPFWCINHGLTISMYYYDPDGNALETQYDIFTDNGAANQYMLTPAFAKNPIGAVFDPEAFIKRIESGETLESLCARPDVGPQGLDDVPTITGPVPVTA